MAVSCLENYARSFFMNGLILCTKECNLRCEYCFEESMHSDCMLSPKQIKTQFEYFLDNYFDKFISELIEINKKINRKETDITFHGGEALLIGTELFEKALRMIKKYPNMTIGIQTNATLINEKYIELFKKYDVKVGVSLDGPKHMHDAYRKGISGSNTYDIVMNRINQLKDNGILVGALATVTDITVRNPEEFYDFFVQQNIPFSFNPCFIEEGAKSSCKILNMVEYIEFYKKIFDLWINDNRNNMEIACFERIISAMSVKKSPYMEVCTYIPDCSKTTVAINVDGDFYRCLHYCMDEKNKIGNIAKDNLNIAYGDTEFSKRWVTLKNTECRTCDIQEFCCGGCPYVAESLNGTMFSRSNTCASQKAIVHHIYNYLKSFSK